MSAAASRAVLRHTKLLSRRTALRHASTTSKATEAASNTASKAKEKTSEATSKASQGLSRVTSSAQSGISKASENITSGLSKIGGRTGRMISSVQCEFSLSAQLDGAYSESIGYSGVRYRPQAAFCGACSTCLCAPHHRVFERITFA